MQKNKSFQKPNRSSKQINNTSSKALLELSEITVHSKDKHSNLTNLTERSATYHLGNFQNSLNQPSCKKVKQDSIPRLKKQKYIKKNISLSNNVLKQIMQMSSSLPMNNSNFQSSKIKQNQNDLIVFSKKDLQKGRNNTQTKKNKKLMLYENKQNLQKVMSKSKSSYGQALKGQGIICSIKIHPMQEQRGSQNFSSSLKRQSFDARRSSLSSRRSSIHLFPQDDFASESRIREIKRSILTKFSVTNHNINNQEERNEKGQNFLKKSPDNFFEEINKAKEQTMSKQTYQNNAQITPRETKQTKDKYLFKLDQLSVIEDDIKKDAFQFIDIWEYKIQSEKNLKKYQKMYSDLKRKQHDLINQHNHLNSLLFEQNKRFVLSKRMSNNNYNTQKQNVLLQVERSHTEVKKKVFKKDLQEMMIFNMKVVLPSSEIMESSVSCFDNHIHSTLSYSNISILQLYEELMNQKACKKYGTILKKEINNMNIYDNRTMNEYLRKLYELQNSFHKVHNSDPQQEIQYLDRIEDLVEKIEQITQSLSSVKRNILEMQRKINENQKIRETSLYGIQNLLNQMSQIIYSQYKIFQTGGKIQISNKLICQSSDINQSFCENEKTIEEFKELVSRKYEELYNRFKHVKEEKKLIRDSLMVYE